MSVKRLSNNRNRKYKMLQVYRFTSAIYRIGHFVSGACHLDAYTYRFSEYAGAKLQVQRC
jgi:hypothetical protein